MENKINSHLKYDINEFDLVFESERISFVRVNNRLVDDYLGMINDPEVKKYIASKKQYTREDEETWVKLQLEKNAFCYSMIEKETDDFIGNIEIFHIVDGVGEIGIAITLAKQNQHYGTEAIKSLIKYGYEKIGLKGFDLNVFATNVRAIHCYEKIGFVKDGAGKIEDSFHMTYQS